MLRKDRDLCDMFFMKQKNVNLPLSSEYYLYFIYVFGTLGMAILFYFSVGFSFFFVVVAHLLILSCSQL